MAYLKRLVVVLVLMIALPSLAAPGVDETRRLADQGVTEAQYKLGYMYHDRSGVAQDYTEAIKWYRLAADQGVANAQYNLGLIYGNGEVIYGNGVLQDYFQSYLWLSISAANGREDDSKFREIIAGRMTPAQIEQAQTLAREWMAAHQ